MKYMGSKNRIAKHIIPIILKDRKPNQYYVEPFVGGANMIDKVSGNRIGADLNHYLIAMWKGLLSGVDKPLEIHKMLYQEARDNYNGKTNSMADFNIGWIGWMASYNGRFFDGGYSGHNVNGRDYISEQIRNTLKQVDNLKGVEFINSSFDELEIPNNSIIYCDPPYEGAKQYTTSKNFNHNDFWQWCRDKTKNLHKVFISEYNAPDDFKVIWSKTVTNSMNQTKTHKPIEKLFVHESMEVNQNPTLF